MVKIKVIQVSEHIWSVKLWLMIPIHVWLVKEKSGITLVDTGLSIMAKGILGAIERLQAGPLQRIVLTHGHPDHIGGLKRILHSNPVSTCRRSLSLTEEEWRFVMFIDGKEKGRVDVEIIELKRQS